MKLFDGRETRLRIVFHQGHDGFIVADCPDIPGCISQGRDKDEALRNITEAIQGCLEVMLTDYLQSQKHGRRTISDGEERQIKVTPALELVPA